MKTILKDRIELAKNATKNEEECGFLMTLDPTTGSGKTTAAVDAIAEILEYEEERDVPDEERTRFLFVTEYKNNLRDPMNVLVKRLKAGAHPELARKASFLDGNKELMKREIAKGMPAINWAYAAIMQNDCPLCRRTEALNALETMKICVRKLAEETPNKEEYEELLSRSEVTFRSELRHELNRYCGKHYFGNENAKSVKEYHRRRALREPKWSWVPILYPPIDAASQYVLFLSTAKLTYPVDPIVSSRFSFWDDTTPHRYVVFFDEYDSNMTAINKRIVDNAVKENFELLDTVKSVGSCLKTDKDRLFDEIFERGLFKRLPKTERVTVRQRLFEDLLTAFDEVYEQYNLYTDFDFSDEEKIRDQFLFHDLEDCMFINDSSAKSYVIPAGEEHGNTNKLNLIARLSKEQRAELVEEGCDAYRLTMLFGQMNGLVGLTVSRIASLSRKLHTIAQGIANRDDDGEGKRVDVYTEASYFRGLLQRLGVTDGVRFKPASAMESMRVGVNAKYLNQKSLSVGRDRSMYANGFKLMQLAPPQESHTHTTWFMTYAIATSPENILLGLVCNNCIVIGLSATASIETVIGNFDDDYLSAILGEKRLRLTEDEQGRIDEMVRKSQSHYDRVRIETTLVSSVNPDTGEYDASIWRNMFKSDARAKQAHDIATTPRNDKFAARRYYKATWAFRYFMEHDDMRSFLFYTNAALKDGLDSSFRKDVILNLFALVEEEAALEQGERFSVDGPDARRRHVDAMRARAEEHVSVLYGSGDAFDRRRDAIVKRWERGDKLFVLTPFASTATGQNLQYAIPNNLLESGRVVCTNDWAPNSKKDVDGIFVDRPTNVVTDLRGQKDAKERLRAKIRTLVEIERLYAHGELRPWEKRSMIAAACGIITGDADEDKTSAVKTSARYNAYSALAARFRLIFQTVGRMCRTNMKSETVHVLASDDVLQGVPRDVVAKLDTVLNREFEALLTACGLIGASKTTERVRNLERQAVFANARTLSNIRGMLDNDFVTEKDRKDWENVRELALTSPTASAAERSLFTLSYMLELPAKANRYYYREKGDFEKTEVFFAMPQDGANEVRMERTGLKEMLLIPGAREFMEKNGYATEWAPNDMILTPAAMQNIYKGALGERIGRFVIETATAGDVTCVPIMVEGGYEKMDAELVLKGERQGVYIDFKNWTGEKSRPGYEKEMRTKFAGKLSALGARKGVIANVVPPEGSNVEPRILREDGCSILVVPALVVPDGQAYVPNDQAIMRILGFLQNRGE